MRDYNSLYFVLSTAAAVEYYTIRVLVVRILLSRASRSRCVHGTCLVRYQYIQAPNRLYKSEVRGSVSRVKTPCEQELHHYTYVLQAEEKAKRSFPMERGDPLRSTTLRGIRSARSGLGRGVSTPLPQTESPATLQSQVMMEKRGGRCRTDGPIRVIRVLSCQMRHTIVAFKATCCRSLC